MHHFGVMNGLSMEHVPVFLVIWTRRRNTLAKVWHGFNSTQWPICWTKLIFSQTNNTPLLNCTTAFDQHWVITRRFIVFAKNTPVLSIWQRFESVSVNNWSWSIVMVFILKMLSTRPMALSPIVIAESPSITQVRFRNI